MHATLDHIEPVTAVITTFWFKPENRFRYIAGQFVEITIDHTHDSRGTRRWFTLSSSPTEPLLGITTQRPLLRESSFKQHLFAMKPGDTVHISEPLGDFVLPKDTSIPLIFAAHGVGATPFRSISTWLRDTASQRDITMLQTGRSASMMPFTSLFKEYFGDVFQAKPGTSPDPLAIASFQKPDSYIYLAGPEVMIGNLRQQLEASGIEPHCIITDLFIGYGDL